MKIAILIGINDYENLDKLPGCANDVTIMELLINASHQYDEVYTFKDKDANSTNLNTNLMELFTKNKTIEEVFFYFSGHGQYNENEFFYALQDYDSKRKNQTSLTNSTLDTFIKSVNPASVIKIVDSCNAGINYIKQSDLIEKHFNMSKQKFNDCYFLFSSKVDQYSYADELFSKFTKCLIDSILNSKNNVIRYKYIIDYVSDCFADNNKQKPFFITQGDFTQIFGEFDSIILEPIKKEIELITQKNILNTSIENIEIVQNTPMSLKEIILDDNSRNYCTKEDAENFLQNLHDIIQNYKSNTELTDLYDFKFIESSSCMDSQIKVLSLNKIAEILENSDVEIFAKVDYKEVQSQNAFMTLLSSFSKVADTYHHTFDSPYFALRLFLSPKENFQNLNPYDITFVYLLSKCEVRIYYYYSTYYEYSWGQYLPYNNIEWHSFNCNLNDSCGIKDKVGTTLIDFEKFVIGELKNIFDANET